MTSFRQAEQACFRDGQWDELIALYRRHLASDRVQMDPTATVAILFRLGQILEERTGDTEAAAEAYRAATQIDSSHSGALGQLRRIHTRRREWDAVRELSQFELSIALEPYERVSVHVELGTLEREELGDTHAAERHFTRALDIDATRLDALIGLARVRADQHAHAEAAALWERVVEQQSGPDRATALIALGELLTGALQEPERAAEYFRRALADDPRSTAAVAALIQDAQTRREWGALDDLFERAFNLATNDTDRSRAALAASQLQLAQMDNPAAARLWLERARQADAPALEVASVAADIERRAGNPASLIDILEQWIQVAPNAALQLEVANLWRAAEDDERALTHLQGAHQGSPDSPEVAAALDACLRRLDRHSERIELLERRAALSDSPADKAARLAEIARLQDDALNEPEAALDAWRHCFAVDPLHEEATHELVTRLGKAEDWTALRDVLERACEEGPLGPRAEWLCQLGELVLLRFDEPEASARAFEWALEIAPRSEHALSGLSQIAHSSDDDDAILSATMREADALHDARRLGPLVWEIVRILDARGQAVGTLRWLEQLRACNPGDVACLEALVVQYDRADDLSHEDAWRRALEALASLSSGARQVELWDRLTDLASRAGDLQSAISWAEQSHAAAPQAITTARKLAKLYCADQRHPDRARALRTLSALLDGQEQADCLAELATLLDEKLKDPEAAIATLQHASSLEQAPAQHQEHLAALLERTERYEDLTQLLLEQSLSRGTESGEGRALALRRARLLLSPLSRYEQAASEFRRLHEERPNCPDALAGLEEALRAGSDLPALIQLLENRTRHASSPTERHGLELERATLIEASTYETTRAKPIYVRLSRQGEAPEIAALAATRLEALLERAGDWEALQAHLESTLGRSDRAEKVRRLEQLGALCRDRLARPDQAITYFESAAALAPTQAPLLRTLALLYESEQRPGDLLRVTEAEIATEVAHHREVSLRVRAAALRAEQDPHGAVAHCQRILDLAPHHPETVETLRALYARTQEHTKLIRLLESLVDRARNEEPQSERSIARQEAQLEIAWRYADHLGDLEAAITSLQPEAKAPGTSEPLQAALADLLERAGRHEELIALCRRACTPERAVADHARWQHRLATALEAAGSREEAAATYEAVLRRAPNDAPARSGLRRLYRSLERSESLAALLVEQLSVPAGGEDTPSDPNQVRLDLADLYAGALGRPEDGLDQLRQVLASDPSNRVARGRAIELSDDHAPPAVREQLLTDALEHERDPAERGSLLRRLAATQWRAFDDPGRADKTLEEALATNPGDHDSLHLLQELCEAEGQTARAAALYEREGALVAGDDPARAVTAWIRAGRFARDDLHEPSRALTAFEAAAAIGPLPAIAEREWATLLEAHGHFERYASAMARWCDRADAEAAAQDHLTLADQLAAHERPLEALQRTRRATEHDPRSLAAWDALTGRCADASDLIGAAFAVASAAALVQDREAAPRYLCAARAIANDDAHQAIHWLERAGQADPSAPEARAEISALAFRTGDFERAEEEARAALDLHARGAATTVPTLKPACLHETLLIQGRCSRRRGELVAAARAYEAALVLTPDHPTALSEIIEIRDAQGDPGSARPWIQRLRVLDGPSPQQARHRAILGEACEADDKPDDALDEFDAALRLDPHLQRGHAGRVRCFERGGRTPELIAALDSWAKISDRTQAGRLYVQAARLERSSDREAAAQGHLRRAVELDPSCEDAWVDLAELLADAGDNAASRTVLQDAERFSTHDPFRARLGAIRAAISERDGNIEDAADAWRQVASLDPTQSQAALETARLLGDMGRWSAALDALEQFLSSHPAPTTLDLAAVHDERGRLLAGPAEDVPGAIGAYEHALAINPDHRGSRAKLAALLAAIPGRQLEAVGAYARLLQLEPTDDSARRALLSIARANGLHRAVTLGEYIEQALAAPSETDVAPVPLLADIASPVRMIEHGDEAIREALRELRPAIETLVASEPEPMAALARTRAELSAGGLDSLSDAQLHEIICGAAALALDPSSEHASTALAKELAASAQPRALRRARRRLATRTLPEVCRVDAAAWRAELSALAAARLLGTGAYGLRSALEMLLAESGQPADEIDITHRSERCPATRALLIRVVGRWCAEVDVKLRGHR